MSKPVERWLETFMCKQYAATFDTYGFKTLQSVGDLGLTERKSKRRQPAKPLQCQWSKWSVSICIGLLLMFLPFADASPFILLWFTWNHEIVLKNMFMFRMLPQALSKKKKKKSCLLDLPEWNFIKIDKLWLCEFSSTPIHNRTTNTHTKTDAGDWFNVWILAISPGYKPISRAAFNLK